MGRWARILAAAGLACATLMGSAVAQESLVIQSTNLSGYPQVSMKVALPGDLVPVRAGDPEPVFSVRENSVDVAGVKGSSEAKVREPVDVVLVIDVSGSMGGEPLADAQAAARSFIDSMGTRDRIALVSFSSEPRVLTGFTTDRVALLTAVGSLSAQGETALYDAIVRSLDLIAEDAADTERHLIVLSDGGDTTSINSLDTATAAVGQADVPVYAVALESEEYDPEPLSALAQRSGGRMVSVTESGEFAAIFEEIAQELRNIYTVTYVSLEPATPELDIELTVSQGDVQRSTRAALTNPLFESSSPAIGEEPELTSASANPFWLGAATLLAFAAGGLLVFALGSILARPSTTLDQLEYYTHAMGGPLVADETGSGVPSSRMRVIESVSVFAERRGFTGALHRKLERAGLPMRPNEYMFFHLLGVVVIGLVAQFVFGNLLVSALTIVIVTMLPIALLDLGVSKRRRRFEEQLPDILGLLAGSLRSGWGISQSLDLVVDEVADPAATEFRRAQSENRFGLPLEDALARMAERLDSDDFRWVVSAIAIQRDVGGNLAELLDTVAQTIRERAQLRREVNSLTAESRYSALVLVILPFFLLLALSVINPEYVSVLTGSPVGLVLLVLGSVLLVLGSWWLNRLTKVEV